MTGPSVRSALAWLVRERCPGHWIDRLARRGGGLVILTGVAFIAGWLLPDPVTLRAYLRDSHEPCLSIAWVARITTGEGAEPGPILLIQSEWTDPRQKFGSHDAYSCRASDVLLRIPALNESIYQRRDGVLVPLLRHGRRPPSRLPIPPEFCLPAAAGTCPKSSLDAT